MPRKPYIFEHFLFVARRGHPPNPWVWEIRCKTIPSERGISEDGFHSAREAEEAGKIVLTAVREAAQKERAAKLLAKEFERLKSIARRAEAAAERATRNTPERRSENARKAGKARAQALSPERRAEISRRGGLASKGKPKGRRPRVLVDSH
jgi:general stress protein YciG